MKKKLVIFIIILSFSLLFSAFYINYYSRNIFVKGFKETDKVEVFKKYKNKKYSFCYGTKVYCKKINYKVKGLVNTNKIGTYTLTYIAKHKDISFIKTMKVKVVDTKKPELKVEGDFNNVCPNGKVSNVKINATDNYDGDISDKVKYKLDDKKLVYKVSDSSDNTTTKEIDVVINDNEKPKLVLNGDSTIYLAVGKKYEEKGAASIDNCDDDISKNIKIEGNVNTSKEGTYELTYKSKDSFGNEASVKRVVKVFKTNSYSPKNLGKKVIYLTFDDGPGKYTARLLDILKQYNVKATFFVTGYNYNYNDLLKREYDEGHTVAIHSYTHNYAKIYTSLDAYMEDLLKMQDKIKQYTGFEAKMVRFPGGSSNTISRRYKNLIMTDAVNKLNELGYKYVDWTIASGDAGDTTDTNEIIRRVTTNLKEDSPNVILQHDIKGFSVDAVEEIIKYGLSNGYTFAPLTMDSPDVHQKLNN